MILTDLRPVIRRLLLAAGLPVLPLACYSEPFHADQLIPRDLPFADAGTRADADEPCVGTWGENRRMGGCQSGPYTQSRDEYLLLDPAKTSQLALYRQCIPRRQCPAELCLEVIGYKPVMSMDINESFGELTKCEPACKGPGQPGIHAVYTVKGSCTGRRPEGLADGPCLVSGPGGYWAEAARLEAASVPAFERLSRELSAHGAPAALVAAARRAAAEEARHFRITGALARRYGATPAVPEVAVLGVRSLEEVALENTVEGCVRETFGAALGAWQAAASSDPTVRTAMAGIADEEIGHASLAAEVDAWARRQLPRSARRRLDSVREEALGSLRPDDASPTLGLPPPEARAVIIEGLRSPA